ncbi:hypothetical protein Pint_04337 [Pistacia integerrima]|uniref:Uncharacterized protein n=1 Tax=Pistacia integerrima TaxID=434235 RepID=A0ACC0Z0G9_9ROSI|nr:hypothetical protein Pint_04337 [Pistacia integerrima]
MGYTGWSSAWRTGYNIWKKLLTVSLVYCLQTRSLQTMATNTVKATIGDGLLSPPRQRSLRFSRDDPTEWFNRWIRKTFQEEGRALSWADFEDELWARFGPSECKDFDEALSRIHQDGSLRDYQWEFEHLGNRVRGWTQRALVGTFMGGLKTDISDGIQMFKPQTLKEAIILARMKDDQLSRQGMCVHPPPPVRASLALLPSAHAALVTGVKGHDYSCWKDTMAATT